MTKRIEIFEEPRRRRNGFEFRKLPRKHRIRQVIVFVNDDKDLLTKFRPQNGEKRFD